MLTHCGPHSNYSAISLPGRGFVAQAWGGRVSGSSPVPLGFSSSLSQLQRPPKIHSKAPPHATTPFASIIKLLSARLGAPAPCYPQTSGSAPTAPRGSAQPTPAPQPQPHLLGELHGEGYPQQKESVKLWERGRERLPERREQEPAAFISHKLRQDFEGAGGARVGQLFVSHHLIQGHAE